MTAVTGAESSHVVPAAAKRDEQIVVAREPQRVQHVRHTRAPHDARRPLVAEAVPDAARLLVLGGALDENTARDAPGHRVYHRCLERDGLSGQRAGECHGPLTTPAIVPSRGGRCISRIDCLFGRRSSAVPERVDSSRW